MIDIWTDEKVLCPTHYRWVKLPDGTVRRCPECFGCGTGTREPLFKPTTKEEG